MRNEMKSAVAKGEGGKQHNLVKIKARSAKRLGRGLGSGKGKTAGRGTKGQKSRSGYNIPRRFEGGQTSLIQRLPKQKGFKSRNPKPAVLNISVMEKKYHDGETVSFKTLKEKGLIFDTRNGVKILGPGKLTKKLKFRDVNLTKKLLENLKNIKSKPAKKVTKKSTK